MLIILIQEIYKISIFINSLSVEESSVLNTFTLMLKWWQKLGVAK